MGGVEGGKGRGRWRNCILILKNKNKNRIFSAVGLLLLVERAGRWKLLLSCPPWWLTVAGWSLVEWQPLLTALGLLCRRASLTWAARPQCHLSGGQYWGGWILGSGAWWGTYNSLTSRFQSPGSSSVTAGSCQLWILKREALEWSQGIFSWVPKLCKKEKGFKCHHLDAFLDAKPWEIWHMSVTFYLAQNCTWLQN